MMAVPSVEVDMIGDASNDDDVMAQKIINEEYKTWKKNSPFLYDILISQALQWPTLTVQWFPDVTEKPGENYRTHRVLLGTHTSDEAANYLQIANVDIPSPSAPDAKDYDEEKGEIGGYGAASPAGVPKFSLVQRIDHDGEVNKARYQPQNPNIIATMCVSGQTMIFDRTKHSSIPSGTVSPQAILLGHKQEGYGLAWNPHVAGHLATGSGDKTMRLWDITQITAAENTIKASRIFTHHTAVVNDVAYHPSHNWLMGTVSDDLTMQIIDVRNDVSNKSAITASGHSDAVNCISFAPASDYILATGSSDKTIGIWDLRNMSQKIHTLEGHADQVTSLEWHPFERAILGSGGYDRRVIFWDLSRIGEEQLPEDVEDGPPELLFMHGGHTNHLSDFSWNKNEPWLVCSAAEDNLIQVWKTTEAIVAAQDTKDIPMNELER